MTQEQVQDRTTIDPISNYAEVMEEMEEALSDSKRQRDERDVEDPRGMKMSQKGKITKAGEPIKDRQQAWRTDDGREIWLPTGTLPYHLSKRRPNGDRVFVLRKPPIAEKIPLDLTCKICERANGYSRKFYEWTQYEDHQEILHPREWQREQRERDRLERLEERKVLMALAERGMTNGATQDRTEGATSAKKYVCETCDRGFDRAVALSGHRRTHS